MGQKHNRRRTRSRPRNRHPNPNGHARMSSTLSTTSETPAVPAMPAAPPPPRYGTPLTVVGRPAARYWDARYAAGPDDDEDERLLRMFGGEKGDETSLCGPMLQVVMDLFDGIDYVDP